MIGFKVVLVVFAGGGVVFIGEDFTSFVVAAFIIVLVILGFSPILIVPVENLIQYLTRKFCLSFRPSSVRPSVVPIPVPRPPKKLRYFRVFSLFNVILCRPPGGARQYPRIGYFLVENISIGLRNILVHPGREIIQFQAIFRGVCKCVYVSISFTNVDEKIPITVKIFPLA